MLGPSLLMGRSLLRVKWCDGKRRWGASRRCVARRGRERVNRRSRRRRRRGGGLGRRIGFDGDAAAIRNFDAGGFLALPVFDDGPGAKGGEEEAGESGGDPERGPWRFKCGARNGERGARCISGSRSVFRAGAPASRVGSALQEVGDFLGGLK